MTALDEKAVKSKWQPRSLYNVTADGNEILVITNQVAKHLIYQAVMF